MYNVILRNLYHIEDDTVAYFRNQGIGCFDFVSDKKFASKFTKEEAEAITKHTDYYIRMYGASEMAIIPAA